MAHKVRETFYILTLVAGLLETFFGFFSGSFDGFSRYLHIFGHLAGGFATITWIWTSVLLSYGRRPISTHPLTRASIHFISFASLTPIWLALCIMILTQVPSECDLKRPSDGEAGGWCGNSATAGAFAFTLFIFCGISAIVVYRAAKRSGSLAVNIAQTDKAGPVDV